MNIPEFTAHTSVYRSRNRYSSSGANPDGSTADQSIVPAYIPGPATQQRCSDCLHNYVVLRDICLAKTAVMVTEACVGSLGFGCGGAIAWGYQEAMACEEGYAIGFGLCHIPGGLGKLSGPCCPKVCGVHTPGSAGSGCCDHGETCMGIGKHANTRDGCCPSGRYCGGNCCAEGESCCGETCCPADHYCLDGYICNELPGTFDTTVHPTPPPTVNNCIFGGEPCGGKCCPPGQQCCLIEGGHVACMTNCVR